MGTSGLRREKRGAGSERPAEPLWAGKGARPNRRHPPATDNTFGAPSAGGAAAHNLLRARSTLVLLSCCMDIMHNMRDMHTWYERVLVCILASTMHTLVAS